jgi:hypothetical protein
VCSTSTVNPYFAKKPLATPTKSGSDLALGKVLTLSVSAPAGDPIAAYHSMTAAILAGTDQSTGSI